jgi:hypothetical protein
MFREQLLIRLQKTFLAMLKLSFLSWVVGVALIWKGIVPCKSIWEFALFTGAVILPAVAKRLRG